MTISCSRLFLLAGAVMASHSASALEVPMTINGATQTLILAENPDYPASAAGTQHYTGKIKGDDDSWVRISHMGDGSWSGMVSMDDAMHFVDKGVNDQHQTMQAVPMSALEEPATCGVEAGHGHVENHSALLVPEELAASFTSACNGNLVSRQDSSEEVCVFADLEVAFDQSYQTAFAADLQGSTDSLFNMVEGYYLNQFNIAFNITNQVFLTDATNIYTTSTNASTLLGNIYSRRCEQIHGTSFCNSFRPNYDGLNGTPSNFVLENNSILHLMTGRDFDGSTVGIAFTDTFCGEFTVGTSQLSRSFNGSVSLPFSAAIIAHEIGHNYGSAHDGDGNSCPNTGFVMNAIIGALPTEFSSCSEEVVSQNMADHINDSCATAPVDLTISAGSVAGTPLIGFPLSIDNAFSVNNTDVGFRNTGNTQVAITASGATISSLTIGGSACTVAAGNTSATCDISVATGGAASDVDLNLTVTGSSVSITATDQTTNLFRDTDRSNSNASLNFAANSASASFSINASDIGPTNNQRPTISGTTDLPNNSTITVSINGSQVCSTTVSGSNWSCVPGSNIANGSFTAAINGPGDVAANINIQIDIVPPTITANNIALTNNARPTMSGTTNATSAGSVRVETSSGSLVCNATINGSNWSCTPGANQTSGNFNAIATDTAGNTATASFSAAIDVTPPTITFQNVALGNDSTPTLQGTTDQPNGATVSVTRNGSGVCNATVNSGNWSCSGSVPEGNSNLIASTTDAAGNTNTANINIEIDLTAPTITANNVGPVNSARPPLSGSTNLGSGDGSIEVRNATNQLVCNATIGTGTWSCTPGSDQTGGNFTARAQDNAGNASSANFTVLIDLTAPSVSVNAQTTNQLRPTISGTTDQPNGSTITVRNAGNQTLCTASANSGQWSCTSGIDLSEGNNSISASTTDLANNTGSNSNTVFVDRTAPMISIEDIALSSDNTPLLRGTSDQPNAATVTVTNATNQTLCTGTVNNGNWFCTVTLALPEGANTVTARTTDVAGNTGSANASVTIDTQAPAITANNIGPVNNQRPQLNGTTDLTSASGSIVVRNGGNTVCTATITAPNWQCTPTADLSSGTLSATATDSAGNTRSVNFNVDIDLSVPNISLTGPLISNQNRPALTGTTDQPNNTTVSVRNSDNTLICSAQTNAGNWSCTPTTDLAEGSNTLSISTTDAARNTATIMAIVSIDTVAPSITANAFNGDTTNPEVSGTTDLQAGAGSITISSEGNTLCEATIDNGSWRCTTTTALSVGSRTYTATATDLAGNQTQASATITINQAQTNTSTTNNGGTNSTSGNNTNVSTGGGSGHYGLIGLLVLLMLNLVARRR